MQRTEDTVFGKTDRRDGNVAAVPPVARGAEHPQSGRWGWDLKVTAVLPSSRYSPVVLALNAVVAGHAAFRFRQCHGAYILWDVQSGEIFAPIVIFMEI